MIRYEPGPTPGTDCHAISVRLAPIGDPALPVCRGVEQDDGIPQIHFEGEGYHTQLNIDLGNVTDPVDYLRRLSRQIAAFAADVEKARDERMPEARGVRS